MLYIRRSHRNVFLLDYGALMERAVKFFVGKFIHIANTSVAKLRGARNTCKPLGFPAGLHATYAIFSYIILMSM